MLNPNLSNFGGECSDDEISRCIKHGEQSDVIIGIGGGKTINTAKIVAYKLNARMITVPTIALLQQILQHHRLASFIRRMVSTISLPNYTVNPILY